jgi:hypothetical protein
MLEHDVCRDDSDDRAHELSHDVARYASPREGAFQRRRERHCRVEACAGDRCEREDQCHEDRARGDAVREQRERCVAAGQPLAHDPRADDGRDQECSADTLADDGAHARGIFA